MRGGNSGASGGGGQSRHTLVLDLDTSKVDEQLRRLRTQLEGAVGGAGAAGARGGGAGQQQAGGQGGGGQQGGTGGGRNEFASVYAIQELSRVASAVKDIALMSADPYATGMQRSMSQAQVGMQAGGAIAGGAIGFAAGGPMGAMVGAGLGGMAGELASGMMSTQFKAQANMQESLRAVFERENTFRAQHGIDPLTDEESKKIKDELSPMFAEIERGKIRAAEQAGEGPDVVREIGSWIENATLDVLGEFRKALTGAAEDARELGRATRSSMVFDFGTANRILESARNESDRAANGSERPGAY